MAASTSFQIPRKGKGHLDPNLFHLLLQGIKGVSPGQQLLQAAQLSLLLLTVLLLLLPLLLQRSDLGFIAADGVWWGRKGRGEGESVHWQAEGSPSLTCSARQFTIATKTVGFVKRLPWVIS